MTRTLLILALGLVLAGCVQPEPPSHCERAQEYERESRLRQIREYAEPGRPVVVAVYFIPDDADYDVMYCMPEDVYEMLENVYFTDDEVWLIPSWVVPVGLGRVACDYDFERLEAAIAKKAADEIDGEEDAMIGEYDFDDREEALFSDEYELPNPSPITQATVFQTERCIQEWKVSSCCEDALALGWEIVSITNDNPGRDLGWSVWVKAPTGAVRTEWKW